jgi:hypothetical protein
MPIKCGGSLTSPANFSIFCVAATQSSCRDAPRTLPAKSKPAPIRREASFSWRDDVPGVLSEGFRICRHLSEPLPRAIFILFERGNGLVARAMMNAEFAAAEQVRALIPIAYRPNYLSALRALSASAQPEPMIRTLALAQRFVAAIPWHDLNRAQGVWAHRRVRAAGRKPTTASRPTGLENKRPVC